MWIIDCGSLIVVKREIWFIIYTANACCSCQSDSQTHFSFDVILVTAATVLFHYSFCVTTVAI